MSDESWHDLGPAADLKEGDLRGALVDGNKLCIGRSGDSYFAVHDVCPHAAGSLSEGMVDEDQVICPLHAYGFEIKTGHCPDDPSCSIQAYEVRVEDGALQVKI
jgi:NAD(P)H-dependent nitrite reductase small subunit